MLCSDIDSLLSMSEKISDFKIKLADIDKKVINFV